MKTQHFIYCLAIVAVFFTACKKDTDYRDKWTGSYDCEEKYDRWDGAGNHEIKMYQVNVIVTTKGDELIDFFENRREQHYEVRISKDGSFYETDETGSRLKFEGKFHSDSLILTVYHALSPASSDISYYKGKKNKSN